MAGGLLRGLCYRTLGSLFRWELCIQRSHKLITSGPYSIVRHPSYTGALLVFIGHSTLLLTKGTVLHECLLPAGGLWVRSAIWFIVSYRASIVAWLSWRTIEEDAMLRKQFGEEWDKWAAKTYRMIPFVW
jgi:protein-S-isoprenylcysteine O-methyltransferase Ste14